MRLLACLTMCSSLSLHTTQIILRSQQIRISIITETLNLKVPSIQIGSAWEWYHWIRHQPLYVFFLSLIFNKNSKFWDASCKNESNLLLVWITVCMCSNSNLFCQTVLQKCRRDINCSLDYGSWVKNSNILQFKPKYSSTLEDFFSSNKSVSADMKTGFYANCDPNKQGGWIHFFMKQLRIFKYSRVK